MTIARVLLESANPSEVGASSDTGALSLSDATLIRLYSDCTSRRVTCTDPCRRILEYLGLCAELGGRPLDFRHQFGWPQALDALPPSLISPWKCGLRAMALMRSAQFSHSRSPVPDPSSPEVLGITTPFPPPPRKAVLSVFPPVAEKGRFPPDGGQHQREAIGSS